MHMGVMLTLRSTLPKLGHEKYMEMINIARLILLALCRFLLTMYISYVS